MGKAKLNNPVWQFCIFYILGCSLLLTAFYPIRLAGPQAAYAQSQGGDLFPPLPTDEPAVITPVAGKEKAQSYSIYDMPVNGFFYYYGYWQSPITSDPITDDQAIATQVSDGSYRSLTSGDLKLHETESSTTMGGQDTACLPLYASRVVEYRPGLKINEVPIEPPHEIPENALGIPDEPATPNYVSLGYRSSEEYPGFIILEIDALHHNYTVASIEIVENIIGNYDCSTQSPTIRLFVSEDRMTWQPLADMCQTQTYTLPTPLTFRYLKIQDISLPGLFPSGENGYNLDGIVVTACEIATPTPTFTSTPSDTPTDIPTAVPTDTATDTPITVPTDTPTFTFTPSLTPQPPIFTQTITPTPTATRTPTPIATKTQTRTDVPLIPTSTVTRPPITTSTTAPSVTPTPVVSISVIPIPSETCTPTNTPTPTITLTRRPNLTFTPSPTVYTPTPTPTDEIRFVSTGRALKVIPLINKIIDWFLSFIKSIGEFVQNSWAVIALTVLIASSMYVLFGPKIKIKRICMGILKSIIPPSVVQSWIDSLVIAETSLMKQRSGLEKERNSIRFTGDDEPNERQIKISRIDELDSSISEIDRSLKKNRDTQYILR